MEVRAMNRSHVNGVILALLLLIFTAFATQAKADCSCPVCFMILSPNGGEVLQAGSSYRIEWDITTCSCCDDPSDRLEYSLDGGMTWNTIVLGSLWPPYYDWTVPNVVSNSCLIRICGTVDDPCDESDSFFSIEHVLPPSDGFIHGRVESMSQGLLGVPVQLCVDGGECVSTHSDEFGEYQFDELDAGDYIVSLPSVPLGYEPSSAISVPVLVFGDTTTVNFYLTEDPSPSGCGSRSNWFWAWQTWGAINGHMGFSYGQVCMDNFREAIHVHFDPHFDHFEDVDNLWDMFQTLFRFWTSSSRKHAKSHYYALLLNVVSDRMNTYDVISTDGATIAQAIFYMDQLLDENTSESDKYVRGLARAINWNFCIPAGMIPLDLPNIAYKDGAVEVLPATIFLSDNYPNPFNPMTTIRFGISAPQHVRLTVLNIRGQSVATLLDESRSAGVHTVQWDAGSNATGVYFYRIEAGLHVETKKMLLMK